MGGEKSRKAFLPFPFNGGDTASVLAHLSLACKRKWQKLDRSSFAQQYINQASARLKAQIVPDRYCHICGFSLIQLTASSGWTIETCSAHELDRAVKNGSLVNFLNAMENEHSYNRSDEPSKV